MSALYESAATPALPKPARRSIAQRVLVAGVQGYRLLLKAWIGNRCRFEPSCSAYALAALQRHGALRGSALGAWRVVRCNPWCAGGCDPVPEHFPSAPSGRCGRLLAPVNALETSAAAPSPPPTRNPP